MITSKWFRPGDDIKEALEIRRDVFWQELGLSEDQDVLDQYAYHLVLYYNGEAAAYGRISYGGKDTALLEKICVLPGFRRQGIGDGLVKVLDYKASQLGMKYSRVETVGKLEQFYGRIGYTKTDETIQKYGMDLMILQKETNDGTRENCAHQCTGTKGKN